MSKSQSIEIPVSDFHLKRNCGNKINLLPIFFGEFFFAQPSQLLLFLNSLLLSFDCRRWRRANSPNNTLSKLAKRQSDQRDANPCKESNAMARRVELEGCGFKSKCPCHFSVKLDWYNDVAVNIVEF